MGESCIIINCWLIRSCNYTRLYTLLDDYRNIAARAELTYGIATGIITRLYSASPTLYQKRTIYHALDQASQILPMTHAEKVLIVSKYLEEDEK